MRSSPLCPLHYADRVENRPKNPGLILDMSESLGLGLGLGEKWGLGETLGLGETRGPRPRL